MIWHWSSSISWTLRKVQWLDENLMVVATVTFGDMLISKTMTVMTSDHTKTKSRRFPQDQRPGQLRHGVGRSYLEPGEPGSVRHHI